MAELIYYDLSTDKAYREDKSQIANQNLPENVFDVTADFELQLLNSITETAGVFADKYTGFASKTIAARAVVDNNFDHTSTALLSVALVNATPVATITIKTLGSDFNTTRPAGTLNLSLTEAVNYNAIVADGANWIVTTADANFATANFTPTADYAEDLAITSVEIPLIVNPTVDVTNKDTGLFAWSNDTSNTIFASEINGLEELEGCKQEITFVEDGTNILKKRFSVGCLGAIDYIGTNPPASSNEFYNKTQSDSRYVRQALSTAYTPLAAPAGTEYLFVRDGAVSKYISTANLAAYVLDSDSGTSQTISNMGVENITLGDKTIYRAFEVFFTVDQSGNYHTYTYRVIYNGLDTTDDGGNEFVAGTPIAGVTITFDLTGDNLDLVIANSSGGSIRVVWKVTSKLILST